MRCGTFLQFPSLVTVPNGRQGFRLRRTSRQNTIPMERLTRHSTSHLVVTSTTQTTHVLQPVRQQWSTSMPTSSVKLKGAQPDPSVVSIESVKCCNRPTHLATLYFPQRLSGMPPPRAPNATSTSWGATPVISSQHTRRDLSKTPQQRLMIAKTRRPGGSSPGPICPWTFSPTD